ncbi:lipoprotein insertase outer membrane protein LolB [Herbaspirillum lusitanum]|uniref:Outer-membrane lipoprotein LolB n=1 Tax=Herbaspirillum lusitanum TaxID=213312 RepID=A0ABW9AG15_9BURK
MKQLMKMAWFSFDRSAAAGGRAAALSCLLAASALLAGCAGMSGAPDSMDKATPLTTRSYQEKLDLNGRLSVQYEQNNQPQALHGSFIWAQSAQQTSLELLSPLGQTMATIDVKPGMATLMQSGQAPRMAADVDTLTAETLGWPLPVSGLRHWLQGFGTDAVGKPFQAVPGEAGSSFTTRDGWRLTYSNWEAIDGQSRPKRIDLARDTAQAGPVSIRIVIDSWKTP